MIARIKQECNFVFTFYCSSIKTAKEGIIWLPKGIFTFYCSSIKTKYFADMFGNELIFTFYCSSIKTKIKLLENATLSNIYILL